MNKIYRLKIELRLNVFLLLFLFSSLSIKAQVNTYSFNAVTGTAYSELAGGTVLGSSTGTSGNASLDDVIYSIPTGAIPFSFIYNNTAYSGCKVSSNGFISFDTTITPSATVTAGLSSAETYKNAVALFSLNLNAYFSTTNPATQNGEIRYQTLGSSPNRIFVIQWKNFKLNTGSNTYTQSINGQIRLHETSNVVDLVYNITAAFAGATAQVGLRGINNTYPANVFNRLLAAGGNWATGSSNGATATSTCSFATSFPVSGLIYRFTPPCFAPQNLAVSNIKQTTAQLSWTTQVAGTAKVEYGLSGFTQGTGVILNNAISPLSISNLSTQTNYQFYVTQSCASGGTGVTGPFSFTSARPGDECSTAPLVNVSASLAACSYTLVQSGITKDGPNAICSDNVSGNNADDDMWFKFVAPAGGKKIVITTQAGTNNDWVMELWSACSGSGGVVLKCSDDANGTGMPEINLCQNEYTAGQTYYVRAWTYAVGGSGTMNMCIYQTTACIIPPVNDDCINATILPIGIPLSCPGSSQSFTTLNATVASGNTQPTCDAGAINDVWFKFNTLNIGNFTLTLKAVSAPSLKASLVFECGGAELQCFSPAAGGTTYSINNLNPSADYFIRVWSAVGQSGTFEICLADVCDDATASISGGSTICAGGTAQLKVNFSGLPPWNVTYSNGSSNTSFSTSTNPYFINVSPTVTTTYNLVSVSSPYCSGAVIGSPATVTLVQPQTVTLAAQPSVCGNQPLTLTGGLPAGGAYTGTGVTGNVFTPPSMNAGSYTITYTYGAGSGCYRSATQMVLVKSTPVISAFSPGTAPVGSSVTLNGSNFTGTSNVKFNTTNASSFTVPNSSTINAVIGNGTTSGKITVQLSNGCSVISNDPFTIGTAPIFAIITVKAFIQGLYDAGSHRMNAAVDPVNRPLIADTVKISLASSVSPYNIVSTIKNTLNTSGVGTFAFPSSMAGNSYYVVINHRNSVETWSSTPYFLSTSGLSIDFTVPKAVQRNISPNNSMLSIPENDHSDY